VTKSIYSAQYKRLRALLVRYREQAGYTQADLAASIGRPQSFVSKVESGERRLDMTELIQVLTALGADPLEFVAELLRRKS
jgi:transcriptional regulator with XRE-family HTH domain